MLVQIQVEDLDRALLWFGSAAFKEASANSTAVGRDFYVEEKRQLGPLKPRAAEL